MRYLNSLFWLSSRISIMSQVFRKRKFAFNSFARDLHNDLSASRHPFRSCIRLHTVTAAIESDREPSVLDLNYIFLGCYTRELPHLVAQCN